MEASGVKSGRGGIAAVEASGTKPKGKRLDGAVQVSVDQIKSQIIPATEIAVYAHLT